MFGTSGFYLKLAGAVAFFLACSAYCYRRGLDLNPSIRLAELKAPRYDGAELWVPSATVTEVRSDRFFVRAEGTDVVVLGRIDDLRAGDVVELSGTYRSAPSTLELARGRKARGMRFRRGVETVSVLVLVGVLLLFFRRFRVRRGAWEMRWPTS